MANPTPQYAVPLDELPARYATLAKYMDEQMRRRGWTISTMSEYTGVGRDAIARALGRHSKEPPVYVTWNALNGIARGFGIPPENLFRMVGLLKPEPQQRSDVREMVAMFEALPAETQAEVIDYLRYKHANR